MKVTRRELLKGAAHRRRGREPCRAGWPAPPPPRPPRRRELVVAQGGDIAKSRPPLQHRRPTTSGSRSTSSTTSRAAGPDGKLHYWLATEWKLQGQQTWAFKLRQGVKWHNGDPFTSADAEVQPRADVRSRGARRVVQHGAHHHRPDRGAGSDDGRHPHQEAGSAPARAAGLLPAVRSCRRSIWSRWAPRPSTQKPVGTGPVRFVSWTKDDRVVLDANADYWGGKPDFDRLDRPRRSPRWRPAYRALLKGEVDIVTQLPPDQARARSRAMPRRVVAGALYAGLYVLAVNSKRPPLDNPLVKQALSLAIDREAIVKELWRGRGVVPNGAHRQGRQPLRYLAAAPRLRSRGGARAAEEGRLQGRGDRHHDHRRLRRPATRPCPRPSQAMWKDVGSTCKVEVVEYSVRAQMNKDKTFKGLWWSDPTSTLARPRRHDVAAARSRRAPGLLAARGVGRARQCRRASRWTRSSGRGAYKKMTKIFLEHLPWVPILQPYEDYGLQKYVEWTPDPLQQLEIRRFNFKFRRA